MVVFLFLSLWVRSITITGNSVASEKELRSAMILKEPWLFKKSKFYPEILGSDIDAIRTVYMTQGLLGPEIKSAYDIDSTGLVDIRIDIIEGTRTYVYALKFTGNTILSDKTLRSLITTKEGLPFNPLALEEDYLSIIRYYDDLGYHDARVTADIKINDNVDLDYQISEGKKVLVAEVNLQLARPINNKRLKTAIGIREGTILTNRKIAGARGRLYDLNIFSRIRVGEESLASGRRLKFLLEPKKPLGFGIRFGYSSLDGPKATVTCEHRNLIGSLRRIMIIGKLSYNELGSEINYRDPITFGRWFENGIGGRIETRQEIGYRIGRLGGYATIIPRPFSIRYDIERIKISDVEVETLATEGTEWLRTLSVVYNIDHRNDLIKPTRGSVIGNRIEFAGIIPKGKSNFTKNEFRFRTFFPWIGSTIGLRFDFGLVQPIKPSTEIPIHSRFFLGGATTIRGYGENMIGTTDDSGNPLGGERYLLLSFEERIPIFWQFGGVFFIDCGSLEQELFDNTFLPKTGVGAGLRFYTPLGPIRLDYGRNLEGSGSIHFAIGDAF